MEQNTINVFLASSNELSDERVAFGDYVRSLPPLYNDKDGRVEVVKWEDSDASYKGRRTQDEYNDKIRESDIFLALFHRKAGKYTVEEFEVALEVFRKQKLPMVYVFCKKLKWYQWQSFGLRRFKRKLEKELELFYCRYNNIDSLNLKFTQQLLIVKEELRKLKLERGIVTLEGIHVAELANLPFAGGNKDYRQRKKVLDKLPGEIQRLNEDFALYPNATTIQEELKGKRSHFFRLKEEFAQLQKALFETAQHIAAMEKEEMGKELRRATEAFEKGKLEKMNKQIDAIIKKAQKSFPIKQSYDEVIYQGIAALLMKAKTRMAEVNTPIEERIEQVQAIYAEADEWAKGSQLPKEKYDGQLEDYADFLYDYGKYKEAESVVLRLVVIREELYGKDHPATAAAYNRLGMVYDGQGDYAKALEYYGNALDIWEHVLGFDHPDTANSYNNIGNVYYYQGDYAKALEYYGKALDICERVLGSDHPDTAGSYNNIGGVYEHQGEYAKALEYYGKALDIWERMLGPNHPSTAYSYNNIGNVYYYQGDYTKALEYYWKALDIFERVLGPDHPDTATSYNNIGNVYASQGDYSKALEYYGKALDIRECVLDPDHPDIADSYGNIGNVYYRQGKYGKALGYFEKALDIRKRVLDPDNPNTAGSYNYIGSVYEKQRDHVIALGYFEKALVIFERTLGPDHPNTKTVKKNIERCRREMGEIDPFNSIVTIVRRKTISGG